MERGGIDGVLEKMEGFTMNKTISLFSGAMGLDLGIEKAGFEVLLCVENDKYCIETIKKNKPKLEVLTDITSQSAEEILKAANLKHEETDLVVGGPPCQSFSTAGNRNSIKDPRGNLIYHYMRVIAGIRPRFFVMENVKGLVSAAIKHRPLKERSLAPLEEEEKLGSAFKRIREDFEELGYKIIWKVLDAVNYGVPQFRERLILIGSREHEDIFIPQPTHFMVHQNNAYRWQTLGQAIEELEKNPGVFVGFSPERAKYLEMIPPGKNWRALPEKLIPKAMGGAYKSGGGKMGFYRRLSYDEPSPTLVTSPTQKGTMLCHPFQTRPLSISEYARIQTFPDTWAFHGKPTQVYKQIGNAVPVGLGVAIGQMLVAVMNGEHRINTKRTRGTSTHNYQLELVSE